MLKERLALLVYVCTRHAWAVIAASAIVTVLAGVYVARHFAIDTDINKLIVELDLVEQRADLELELLVRRRLLAIGCVAVRADRRFEEIESDPGLPAYRFGIFRLRR